MAATYSRIIAGAMNWGQWGSRFTTEEYHRLIVSCLETGVTTFDHADIYGGYTTEEEFGAALKRTPSLRDKMQLITKCGIRLLSTNRPAHLIKSYDTSREHIIASVERSLQNLCTDHIDLLLLHRPDPLMDPDEIAAAFHLLKDQGKVLDFGVSNFTPSQTSLLKSRFPVSVNQLEISILQLSPFIDGSLDYCLENHLLPMAWSPLGGGRLFNDPEDERKKRVLAAAEILAHKYNASPDQLLLSWLLQHPSGIYPVVGSAKLERIRKAVEATSITLTREEWFILWRASTGKEIA